VTRRRRRRRRRRRSYLLVMSCLLTSKISVNILIHNQRLLMRRKGLVIRQPEASCTDGIKRWGTSDN
jgi:hypothetical protein